MNKDFDQIRDELEKEKVEQENKPENSIKELTTKNQNKQINKENFESREIKPEIKPKNQNQENFQENNEDKEIPENLKQDLDSKKSTKYKPYIILAIFIILIALFIVFINYQTTSNKITGNIINENQDFKNQKIEDYSQVFGYDLKSGQFISLETGEILNTKNAVGFPLLDTYDPEHTPFLYLSLNNTLFKSREIIMKELYSNNKSYNGHVVTSVIDPFFNFNNISKIDDVSEIPEKRKEIIDYIWKDNGLPKNKLPEIKGNQLITEMEYNINSIAEMYNPQNPNNKLIIYHCGHSGLNKFEKHNKSIQFLLNKGFNVLVFYMPLLGKNRQPSFDNKVGNLSDHSHLAELESDDFSPLKLFLEPIYISLNYIEKEYDFDNIYMIGLSGGGWTTVVYSAIDERIEQSYPVAGSLPLSYPGKRDYEQKETKLYDIAGYLDLYLIGAYKRKQFQIFNLDDPIFPGHTYNIFPYAKYINNKLNNNGIFFVGLEDSLQHEIKENTLEIIYPYMENPDLWDFKNQKIKSGYQGNQDD